MVIWEVLTPVNHAWIKLSAAGHGAVHGSVTNCCTVCMPFLSQGHTWSSGMNCMLHIVLEQDVNTPAAGPDCRHAIQGYALTAAWSGVFKRPKTWAEIGRALWEPGDAIWLLARRSKKESRAGES